MAVFLRTREDAESAGGDGYAISGTGLQFAITFAGNLGFEGLAGVFPLEFEADGGACRGDEADHGGDGMITAFIFAGIASALPRGYFEFVGTNIARRGAVFGAAVEERHVTEEFIDEFVGGIFVNLTGRSDLFELAAVHDGDAVGHLERLFLIVGDEDAGDMKLVV
jgi:hypothetical protein